MIGPEFGWKKSCGDSALSKSEKHNLKKTERTDHYKMKELSFG